MTQRNRVRDDVRATERKFYHPAGSGYATLADRIESIWAALFDHGVDGPA